MVTVDRAYTTSWCVVTMSLSRTGTWLIQTTIVWLQIFDDEVLIVSVSLLFDHCPVNKMSFLYELTAAIDSRNAQSEFRQVRFHFRCSSVNLALALASASFMEIQRRTSHCTSVRWTRQLHSLFHICDT